MVIMGGNQGKSNSECVFLFPSFLLYSNFPLYARQLLFINHEDQLLSAPGGMHYCGMQIN